jgi:hypothetical protein
MVQKASECCCAWAGKTGGAIWVCLDFWAPPFASRQKVETQQLTGKIEKVKPLLLQYFARRSMTTCMCQQLKFAKIASMGF